MTSEGERCSACATERAREPGDGGLCADCLADRFPPIEGGRGSKWSPAKLGLLSLICDVLLIPSILAFTRGLKELNEVASREAAGVWRPEHARVRSGAVIAFLTGGLRPLILVGATLLGAITPGAVQRARPVDDELSEVLDRAQGHDEEARELALEHLREIGEEGTLTSARWAELLSLAESRPGPDDALASVIVASLPPSHRVEPDHLRRLYPRLTRSGKQEVLTRLLRTASGVEDALDLLEADPNDLQVHIDSERLLALSESARTYLPRLLALPQEHASHRVGTSVARRLCDRGTDRAVFEPIQNSLIFDYVLPRQEVDEDPSLTLERLQALRALGCVDSPVADRALEAASGSGDPRTAAAAVDALLRGGRSVPSSLIARLAGRLESRWLVYRALARDGSQGRMPAASRRPGAIAEALCDWRVFPVGGRCSPAATLRRRFRADDFDVYVFDVHGSDPGLRVAFGPFADRDPYAVAAQWSEEFGDSSPDALADALVARWESRR